MKSLTKIAILFMLILCVIFTFTACGEDDKAGGASSGGIVSDVSSVMSDIESGINSTVSNGSGDTSGTMGNSSIE